MAEIGGGGLGSVSAMIVGVSPIADPIERGGEPRVASAMLGEAVGDLQDRPRPPYGSERRAKRLCPSSVRSSNSLPGISRPA